MRGFDYDSSLASSTSSRSYSSASRAPEIPIAADLTSTGPRYGLVQRTLRRRIRLRARPSTAKCSSLSVTQSVSALRALRPRDHTNIPSPRTHERSDRNRWRLGEV
jgi:hypothetical protein